jgi:anti-anti-sigma factor
MSIEANHSSPSSPDREPFRCDVSPERDAARVSAVGALDMATAPLLATTIEELHEAGFKHLILDLSRLDFLDSSGLRLILETDAAARADGFSIELIPGPPAVQRVFEVTGMRDRLPFTGD